MESSCRAVIKMITRYKKTKAAESEAKKIKQRNTQLSICLQMSWFRAAVQTVLSLRNKLLVAGRERLVARVCSAPRNPKWFPCWVRRG